MRFTLQWLWSCNSGAPVELPLKICWTRVAALLPSTSARYKVRKITRCGSFHSCQHFHRSNLEDLSVSKRVFLDHTFGLSLVLKGCVIRRKCIIKKKRKPCCCIIVDPRCIIWRDFSIAASFATHDTIKTIGYQLG